MVLLEGALYSVAPEPVRKGINAGVSGIAKGIRKVFEKHPNIGLTVYGTVDDFDC